MINYLEWLSVICITVAAVIFFALIIYAIAINIKDFKKKD